MEDENGVSGARKGIRTPKIVSCVHSPSLGVLIDPSKADSTRKIGF